MADTFPHTLILKPVARGPWDRLCTSLQTEGLGSAWLVLNPHTGRFALRDDRGQPLPPARSQAWRREQEATLRQALAGLCDEHNARVAAVPSLHWPLPTTTGDLWAQALSLSGPQPLRCRGLASEDRAQVQLDLVMVPWANWPLERLRPFRAGLGVSVLGMGGSERQELGRAYVQGLMAAWLAVGFRALPGCRRLALNLWEEDAGALRCVSAVSVSRQDWAEEIDAAALLTRLGLRRESDDHGQWLAVTPFILEPFAAILAPPESIEDAS